MICILSDSTLEVTTEHVMQWLKAWGLPCFRLNNDDLCGGTPIRIWINRGGSGAKIQIGGQEIDAADVKVVWYRRWSLPAALKAHELFYPQPGTSGSVNRTILTHALGDMNRAGQFLLRLFKNATWLGTPMEGSVNKLVVLQEAAECGMDVPETLVANRKQEFLNFLDHHPPSVTKAIYEAPMCFIDGSCYVPFTAAAKPENLDTYPEAMFPSLVQGAVEKAYEIRTFALDGTFYSMAIFSQSREQTKQDFRIYQLDNPCRTVPYQLPPSIEDRLRELMRRVDLDTGSIDMIRTPDGRFVFLEINPVGQFGMVSEPCNYYLDQKVALALKRRYEDACARDAARWETQAEDYAGTLSN